MMETSLQINQNSTRSESVAACTVVEAAEPTVSEERCASPVDSHMKETAAQESPILSRTSSSSQPEAAGVAAEKTSPEIDQSSTDSKSVAAVDESEVSEERCASRADSHMEETAVQVSPVPGITSCSSHPEAAGVAAEQTSLEIDQSSTDSHIEDIIMRVNRVRETSCPPRPEAVDETTLEDDSNSTHSEAVSACTTVAASPVVDSFTPDDDCRVEASVVMHRVITRDSGCQAQPEILYASCQIQPEMSDAGSQARPNMLDAAVQTDDLINDCGRCEKLIEQINILVARVGEEVTARLRAET